ncbi:MAG: DUF3006 domain-containing protein [Ruminococcaceae bacterium]|nr:DUF3006 domain-containing protein [Oscillospiraceae bacterium]
MGVYSVDRIVGDVAVLVGEDTSLSVAMSLLPTGVKEGSVLRVEDGSYVLDSVEEEARRQRILSLQNKVRRKNLV